MYANTVAHKVFKNTPMILQAEQTHTPYAHIQQGIVMTLPEAVYIYKHSLY